MFRAFCGNSPRILGWIGIQQQLKRYRLSSVEVRIQKLETSKSLPFIISLISILVDLGILGDFEFDLGSSNLFHFHVYLYHYCYSCSPSLR